MGGWSGAGHRGIGRGARLMWELMRIGLEMQERMIEVHGKSLDMAREMIDAVESHAAMGPKGMGQAALDMGEAMNRAGKAQADLIGRWSSWWSGRA
ncbi:hypothetical protein [Sphingobium sp. B11D3A]|uniref:hypothetical protein n=2 Tax=unclassified Sphingobium TaxID=2611147 RepID=UPI00222457F0|nr:hypothetical protein [Sphingobium sp. B11D3A]